MDKDAHEGLIIPVIPDSNDTDSNIEAESLISTPEVEIKNYDKSIISISNEEEAEIFSEGARLV